MAAPLVGRRCEQRQLLGLRRPSRLSASSTRSVHHVRGLSGDLASCNVIGHIFLWNMKWVRTGYVTERSGTPPASRPSALGPRPPAPDHRIIAPGLRSTWAGHRPKRTDDRVDGLVDSGAPGLACRRQDIPAPLPTAHRLARGSFLGGIFWIPDTRVRRPGVRSVTPSRPRRSDRCLLGPSPIRPSPIRPPPIRPPPIRPLPIGPTADQPAAHSGHR